MWRTEGTKKIHNEGTKKTETNEEDDKSIWFRLVQPSSDGLSLLVRANKIDPLRSSSFTSFLRCESSSFSPSPPAISFPRSQVRGNRVELLSRQAVAK